MRLFAWCDLFLYIFPRLKNGDFSGFYNKVGQNQQFWVVKKKEKNGGKTVDRTRQTNAPGYIFPSLQNSHLVR